MDFLDLTSKEIEINTREESPSNRPVDVSASPCKAVKETCSINIIEEYDQNEHDFKFRQSHYMCNVCFVEKSGVVCFRYIPCHHVYCNDCMKEYFEVQINEGKVTSLTCPFEKCESQALPLQVSRLLDQELYTKYENLLIRNSLNNMSDILYCPRVHCQSPVIPEENMAHCPSCQYVFCTMCRQGFHGIEPCKLANSELKKICKQYINGDMEVRDRLQKRYGTQRIQKAIEEYQSMGLIERTSKQCPKCKTWMQKLDGCNKMTCSKCRAYFCWICMQILSKTDPYGHFNNASQACFNKLFEGIEVDDADDDQDLNENDNVAHAHLIPNANDDDDFNLFANMFNEDDDVEIYFLENEDDDDDDDDDYEDGDDDDDDDDDDLTDEK